VEITHAQLPIVLDDPASSQQALPPGPRRSKPKSTSDPPRPRLFATPSLRDRFRPQTLFSTLRRLARTPGPESPRAGLRADITSQPFSDSTSAPAAVPVPPPHFHRVPPQFPDAQQFRARPPRIDTNLKRKLASAATSPRSVRQRPTPHSSRTPSSRASPSPLFLPQALVPNSVPWPISPSSHRSRATRSRQGTVASFEHHLFSQPLQVPPSPTAVPLPPSAPLSAITSRKVTPAPSVHPRSVKGIISSPVPTARSPLQQSPKEAPATPLHAAPKDPTPVASPIPPTQPFQSIMNAYGNNKLEETVDFGMEMDYSGYEWFKDAPPRREVRLSL
jgi:hypothetical protein